jgi:hypothetical protein
VKTIKKPEKTPNNIRIEKMCGFCHKPRHLKECCHWNLENLNKKLKDKKEVSMNEISLQAWRGMSGNHENKGN